MTCRCKVTKSGSGAVVWCEEAVCQTRPLRIARQAAKEDNWHRNEDCHPGRTRLIQSRSDARDAAGRGDCALLPLGRCLYRADRRIGRCRGHSHREQPCRFGAGTLRPVAAARRNGGARVAAAHPPQPDRDLRQRWTTSIASFRIQWLWRSAGAFSPRIRRWSRSPFTTQREA